MCVGRPPATHETRLQRHVLKVRAIPIAAGFAQGKRAFVDVPGNGIPYPLFTD